MSMMPTCYHNVMTFFFNQIIFHYLHFMKHLLRLNSYVFCLVLLFHKLMKFFIEKFCFSFKIRIMIMIMIMSIMDMNLSITMHTLVLIFQEQSIDFIRKFFQTFFWYFTKGVILLSIFLIFLTNNFQILSLFIENSKFFFI